MNRLDLEISRLEEFSCSSFGGDSVIWSTVLFVEDMQHYYKNGIYSLPRTALLTREQYGTKFEQLLQVCSWINFQAFGTHNDALIISLEYPSDRKEHGKPDAVSVNFSGPYRKSPDHVEPEWNLANKIVFVE